MDNEAPVTIHMAEVQAMIQPSYETIHATYEALKDLFEEVNANSHAVRDTLQLAADLLNSMEGSSNLTDSISNPLSLPIPLAMKAVALTASKIVEQRTGISLSSWTDMINSTLAQFEDYVASLKDIAELARKTRGLDPAQVVNLALLSQDLELLQQAKVKTMLWYSMTSQVVQLNVLVESLIEGGRNASSQAKPEPPAPGALSGVPGSFKQRVSSLGDKVTDSVSRFSTDHEDWITRAMTPVYALRDKAIQLKSQVTLLSNSIQQFDELIDLEIAQILARLGKISAAEVEILSHRIAVAVAIPRLKIDLTDARKECDSYRAYLEKLQIGREQAMIEPEVYKALEMEYTIGLQEAEARKNKLEVNALTWKNAGGPILQAGTRWLNQELGMVAARELVGQMDNSEASQRRVALKREQARFENAQQILGEL
jgi:hypothetical protein